MPRTRTFRFQNIHADAETHVGEVGSLFFDPTTATLRIGDGTTAGGHVAGGVGTLEGFTSSLNLNVLGKDIAELTAATGSNTSIVLSPYISGFFSLTMPDGSSTGGNQRGYYAVDLQIFQPGKGSATQVASGSFSNIGGGLKNTASDWGSTVAGGELNSATAQQSFVGGGDTNTASAWTATIAGGANNEASNDSAFVGAGQFNVASGDHATIAGGYQNRATGQFSYVPGGGYADTHGLFSKGAVAGISFSTVGDGQLGIVPLYATTADATPRVMTSSSQLPTTVNQVAMSVGASFGFHGYILARHGDTKDSSYWKLEGAIKYDGVTATLVGAVVPTLIAQDGGAAAWLVEVDVDSTNHALKITATGEADKTIRWIARIETEELIF